MATNIDPFATKKKVQPVVQPVNTQEQQNLLFQVAGGHPLPAGGVLVSDVPASGSDQTMTSFEKETMKNLMGWTEGQQLPTTPEGKKALQAAIAAATAKPNLDVTRQPIKVNTVSIDTLPPEKQAELLATMTSIVNNENAQKARASQPSSTIPGASAADAAVYQAIDAFKKSQTTVETESVVVPPAKLPTQETVYQAPKLQAKPAAPTTPPPAPQVNTSETGATKATLMTCPHCAWDLSMPDIDEPDQETKLAFLHCLLGQKPFMKAYPLFGGQVAVTFRTLTTKELDIVYKQVHTEVVEGKLKGQDDVYEAINRYRVMLQTASIKTVKTLEINIDLPEGYSQQANPHVDGFWVKRDQEDSFAPDETGLPAIAEYMLTHVFKTESLLRVTSVACNQFNRTVSKLEGMADNSDFWKQTVVPY